MNRQACLAVNKSHSHTLATVILSGSQVKAWRETIFKELLTTTKINVLRR